MTPSFVPKEPRKRNLEKKAALKAMEEKRKYQAAKKLAEKIAKAYHKDREEKWPWDQHDSTKREIDSKKLARDIYLRMKRAEYEKAAEIEKRPKKKQGGLKIGRSSTIEGISEAIGNKFKEKIQRSRETSEKSTTKSAESNKSKESNPKEKNASESRQDRKRRPRTKEAGTKERPVEGSRKRREPRTSERKATKTATEPSREGVSDSSGKSVKERKQAKGISDTDNRKHHRKSESSDNSKRRELETRKSVSDEKKVRVYEVKMYKPEIRGVHFRSLEDLREYIDTELPGMKHLPYFEKMMSDAEGHLKLSDRIGDKKGLTLSEIRGLSEQTGVSFRTARKWVYGESKPNLYRLAETAFTKSEAKVILHGLREQRNGVDSAKDIERRLDTYYFGQDVRRSSKYKRDLDMAHRYFQHLELLSEGGVPADIARRVGVSRLTAVNWSDGIYPRLVKRAMEIPCEMPKEGRAWLSMEIDSRGVRSGFIQVRVRVESWSHVQEVLDQLEPLIGPQMERWSGRFGPVGRNEAFMHLLGTILSDGYLGVRGSGSARMVLPLSKTYSWSSNFGDASCFHLGLVGIHARLAQEWNTAGNIVQGKHGPRRIVGPGFHVWESSHSPFLTWVRRSCLGLKDSQTKVENPVHADWVLSAPENLRKSFVQGVCDGDGHVCVNSQEVAIGTKCNQPFYKALLKTLGIESLSTPKESLVKQSNSILRASEIPLFKYAESRLHHLEELADIISARKSKPANSRLSPKEIKYACSLRERGLSYGGITRRIFHELGNSWDISTIEHAIKRHRTEPMAD
jgi:hypothetical protein